MSLKDINNLSHRKQMKADLPKSHNLCPKVPQKGGLQRKTSRSSENTAAAMRAEGSKNTESGSMRGSHPYVSRDTAKDFGAELHWLPEREERHKAVWQFGELKYKYRSREFWSKWWRCVDTVEKMRAELWST